MQEETKIINEIAERISINPDVLLKEGVRPFLMERKRKLMIERLEMLSRYGVGGVKELEEKIRRGGIPEHPAWEDLIELTNLENELRETQHDIEHLSETPSHSRGRV